MLSHRSGMTADCPRQNPICVRARRQAGRGYGPVAVLSGLL